MQIRFPWFTLNGSPNGRAKWRCAAAMLLHEALHLVRDPHTPGLGYRQTLRYAIGDPVGPNQVPMGKRGEWFYVSHNDEFPPMVAGGMLFVFDGDAGAGHSVFGNLTQVLYGSAGNNDWIDTPFNVSIPDTSGMSIVHRFQFNHSDSNLHSGTAVYTPAAGDVLLDMWLEVSVAWNGTTPKFEVGDFVFGNVGWLSTIGGVIDLTAANTGGTGTVSLLSLPGASHTNLRQILPSKFTTTDPIKICVSQDGTTVGGATGATAGSAYLYFVTATPTG